jgi:hypothetical protein
MCTFSWVYVVRLKKDEKKSLSNTLSFISGFCVPLFLSTPCDEDNSLVCQKIKHCSLWRPVNGKVTSRNLYHALLPRVKIVSLSFFLSPFPQTHQSVARPDEFSCK